MFWNKKEVPAPVIGQVYQFRVDKGNPWAELKVKVEAVKNGWVKYRFMHNLGGRYSEGGYGSLTLKGFDFTYVKESE